MKVPSVGDDIYVPDMQDYVVGGLAKIIIILDFGKRKSHYIS